MQIDGNSFSSTKELLCRPAAIRCMYPTKNVAEFRGKRDLYSGDPQGAYVNQVFRLTGRARDSGMHAEEDAGFKPEDGEGDVDPTERATFDVN